MARAAVMEGLSDHPQTLPQIKKQVTRSYRDQAESIIPELISSGTITAPRPHPTLSPIRSPEITTAYLPL